MTFLMYKFLHLRYALLGLLLCCTVAVSRVAITAQTVNPANPNAPLRTTDYTLPIRIACVGDSITAGVNASTAAASYPSLLVRLLGSQFAVGNFGVSGTTLLKSGNLPYWNTPAFRQVGSFNPQVVLIMLGTNDSKAVNWADKPHFAADTAALIASFRALPSHPRIWLCLPPSATRNSLYIQGDVIDKQVVPILGAVAATTKAGLIDVHRALLAQPDVLSDGVHPNDTGYAIIAATIYRALAGAPSIWPNGDVFLDSLMVTIVPPPVSPLVVYTLDGSDPGYTSPRYSAPLELTQTTVVKTRALWTDGTMSPVTTARFARVTPLPAVSVSVPLNGLVYRYYEGAATVLQTPAGPSPVARGTVANFNLTPRRRDRYFGLTFDGYLEVPTDSMYQFTTTSDDGSLLSIDGRQVVNSFRSHHLAELGGKIALAAGRHRIEVSYYQFVGEMGLEVSYAGPGLTKRPIPDFALSHESAEE